MKPPTESPPNVQQNAGAASGAPKQKPVVEPPTQPFIIVDGDGPGDPSKFQKFIVPMEFIQKVNSVELPGLDPDDLKDTAPPNRPLVAPEGRQVLDSGTKSDLPNLAQAAAQETVVVPKRRRNALTSREVLNGAYPEPKSLFSKKLLWVTGGVLVLMILLLSHLKGGHDAAVADDASTAARRAPSTPTLAVASSNPPTPATTQSLVPPHASARLEIGVASSATSVSKNPSNKSPKVSATAIQRSTPAIQTKSIHQSQSAPPTVSASPAPGKTPWFIQDN